MLVAISMGCARPQERGAPAAPESGGSGSPERRVQPSSPSSEVFLWSLPLATSEEARARVKAGQSEEELGRHLRLSFQLDAGPTEELRRRFPHLSASEGNSSPFTLAPVVEVLQPVTEERSAATFVVDYDEPAVAELLATVPAANRTPGGLETFVAETLRETHSRGFDIASRTAALKAGDCTEHAVLLTALLRASGYSARIVIGVVVVVNREFALAAGHAWAEVSEDGVWRRLDAALYAGRSAASAEDDPDAALLRQSGRLYLSVGVLESEGPNFARDLIRYSGKFMPHHLRLEAADDAP